MCVGGCCGYDGDRTQLDVPAMTYTTNTDAYWYVISDVPGGVADATCMEYFGSQHEGAVRCNRTRIRFVRSWAQNQTKYEKRQGACHEIGHSLGFDDSQPENNTGCMSGGGLGVSSAHEINHINSTYDPY